MNVRIYIDDLGAKKISEIANQAQLGIKESLTSALFISGIQF
jgi:hypothetical protein